MINTGGKDFRRLSHPIFVNGKKVRQVWMNGTMVYPEISYPGAPRLQHIRGNLIKISGRNAVTHVHSHRVKDPGVTYTPAGYPTAFYGPCTTTYTFSAAFCATIVIPEAYHFLINRNEQILTYANQDNYGHHGALSDMRLNFVSPLFEAPPCPAMGIQASKDGEAFAITEGLIREIKFRFHASPIPVCGPVQSGSSAYYFTIYDADGIETGGMTRKRNENFDSGGYYQLPRIEPTGPFIGPGEFSGRIFTRLGDYESTISNRGHLIIGATFVLGSQTLGGIAMRAYGYMIPARVIKLYRDSNEPQSYQDYGNVYLQSESFNMGNVPFSKILYCGMEKTAPEWALHVTEEDLIAAENGTDSAADEEDLEYLENQDGGG